LSAPERHDVEPSVKISCGSVILVLTVESMCCDAIYKIQSYVACRKYELIPTQIVEIYVP